MTVSIQLFLTEETSTLHAEGPSILGAPHTILLINSHPRSKNVHYGIMRPSSCDKTDKTSSGMKYDVAFKLAYDEEGIRRLKHEHEIYNKDLRALQGNVVPTCYGLFTGTLSGTPIACLVLDFCINGNSNPTIAKEEF